MLEAVASYDLWIWHAFFGVAGANNDLTVLNNSPLFDDLLDDIPPVVPYEVNGVTFEKGYYLADGIYPQWAAFVKVGCFCQIIYGARGREKWAAI
ncbi:ALP1-like protein [Tanacetum coccineum]